jgi:hypothetical protein
MSGEPHGLRCGYCGYELRGLPRRHVCPECGAAYDLGVYEIELSRAGHLWWQLGGAVLVEVSIIVGIWRGVTGLWGAGLFIGGCIGVLIWRLRRDRESDDRIILSADTAAIIVGRRRREIALSDISDARFSWVRHGLELIGRGGGTIVRVSATDLGGVCRTRTIAREIVDWIHLAQAP